MAEELHNCDTARELQLCLAKVWFQANKLKLDVILFEDGATRQEALRLARL